MYLDLSDLLVVVLAVAVPLVIAFRRIAGLERRLAALEGQGAAPEALPHPGPATAADPTEPQTPIAEPTPPAPPPPLTPSPVAEGMARLVDWLRTNWIYPVAGAALVMAAVYLLQYSIEAGLLSPAARIALALALGAGLVTGGEALRRRWGDGAAGARLVPATLAGAGAVTLFATVLAAHRLYDMIDPVNTLILLALVAVGAMALGWLQGPFLAAIGLVAGSAAPFLLGAGGTPGAVIHAYFGALAVLGLGIDGLRRWGWVSGLAIVLPLAGAVLMRLAGAPGWSLAALALVVALLGMALPGGALVPRATGPMIHQSRRARPAPEVRIAALAVVLAAAVIVLWTGAPAGILAAGLLALAVPLWSRRAPALADLSLPAAAALPLAIGWSVADTPLMLSYVLNAQPWLPGAALALAAASGLAMAARSDAAAGRARALWAVLAVATPGATVIAAELSWQPLTLLGFTWPLMVMALAAAFTAAALTAARRDGGQGARLGAAAAGAVTMIALAMMLLLSAAALTLALAVLMAAAAALDRRLGIPALGALTGLGALTLGWRLLIAPGLDPILSGGMSDLDVALTLLAVLAGPLVALALIRDLPRDPLRDWGRVIAETALSGLVPVAVLITAARFLDQITPHALAGIEAAVLIAVARVQFERARRLPESRGMVLLRRVLGWGLGLAATLTLALGVFLFSPVVGGGFLSSPVRGWPLINDLALAYLAPALTLWAALRGRPGRRARAGRIVALALGAVWVAHVIRHLWQGSAGMPLWRGFAQGELYAYTVALLLAGAASMVLALRSGQRSLRVAGLALIGLAAAKAFLVDAAGLTGLMRVGAFLGLGLSLAALAWLNAWVAGHGAERDRG